MSQIDVLEQELRRHINNVKAAEELVDESALNINLKELGEFWRRHRGTIKFLIWVDPEFPPPDDDVVEASHIPETKIAGKE